MGTSLGLIAIDPGRSGGVAYRMLPDGPTMAHPLPPEPQGIWELLRNLHRDMAGIDVIPTVAVIEQVGAHVIGNAAQSTAVLNRNLGHLQMALIAARWEVLKPVSPRTWQRWLGGVPTIPGVGDCPGAMRESLRRNKKRAIRDIMAARHPHLRVTLKTADALAILAYAEAVLIPAMGARTPQHVPRQTELFTTADATEA